ncbi:histone-lysine N-methyltransferase SETMAR-like isoform X2 [Bombus pyrosoma]|uniref:histone-lysine N-methyltransferase SETMAR-like isoform X2 n=1 Tax=Bombus pyrosoma TaxID=396416 RepID=UPI001CB953B3|nr:histone-lysine N-methyltransferase SETMAR-like isoform X2 [Bombus pyrosoma]XP_043591660.1 histone-lysine N-methyltransferase SETMAR-like isoform X2 [Bombus pyrosoma]
MLYEFKKGSATMDTVKYICQVYGEHVLNARKCERWSSKFQNGVFELADEARSGRRVTFDVEALIVVIEAEPHLTTEEIANRVVVVVSYIDICIRLEKLLMNFPGNSLKRFIRTINCFRAYH